MRLVVLDVAEACAGVRTLRLGRPGGGPLPAHPPGGHVVVVAGDRRNAYSLTGDGGPADHYEISVLRKDAGSAWMHRLEPGDPVEVSAPRSRFAPVAGARRHLLVAGGIGVTPMLSHARAAVRWDRPFLLLYGYRPGHAAHLPELRELCGDRLLEYPGGREDFAAALTAALRCQPLGTHVYVCGPGSLIGFVLEQAAEAGWPPERVHVERFAAEEAGPGVPFDVRLRSGRRVPVPSGVSLLEALERAGITLPSMCRQGVCGECRTGLLAGRALHRDLYLTAEERSTAIMPCVSRADADGLELDL
ncbi:PDR/VanB family oxidoreductase [Actinocorallia longicatena]|uniref:PDR/VanB family oxidoreductase n=1 Tax=Actinocorallia longicatena TaxID=111803 RepID=A0ABP6PWJ6_9ACTN